tara:strand:- start:656 stop:1021 length:366 start_codon:yes stop_codon:yes gene_type:complete
MSKTDLKRKNWLKKKNRTKKSLGVLGNHPRLVVFKSNRHIYSQLVDDNSNKTLFSSSSMDKDFDLKKCKSKIDMSKEIGYKIADKMKKNKINEIVFDRNGYLYHGRVKAVAEAVREKGIKI